MKKHAIVLAMMMAAALQAQTGHAQEKQRSARGDLVYRIVTKWSGHVQEAYRADVRRWARDMVPVFSQVPLDTLAKAADAKTFDAMNDMLLNDGERANMSLMQGIRSGSLKTPEKALGDAAADLVYVPVTPCRILDTRIAGGAIAGNTTRDFDVTAVANFGFQGGSATDCGIGSVGSFAAAVINFTVVTPSAAGYITAFPLGTAQPLAATLNYVAGDIRGNLAIVKLDQGPAANELSVYSFAQTHLVGDVVGYFINPQATNFNCVETSVSTFNINANTINFFNNPACPAGYKAITPYCWTASSGVYSQGGGYNANLNTNLTFCAWQNTTGATQQVFGGNVCCRVPGR
ncbi:MAG: hypothetical protein E6Q88_09545 [Lysobacteraceae bacterium]|nr:MAG: hypothetical protein E6Q88_09545 [Xanthomonadaceae bacterium]